jgi:hypothetical protein
MRILGRATKGLLFAMVFAVAPISTYSTIAAGPQTPNCGNYKVSTNEVIAGVKFPKGSYQINTFGISCTKVMGSKGIFAQFLKLKDKDPLPKPWRYLVDAVGAPKFSSGPGVGFRVQLITPTPTPTPKVATYAPVQVSLKSAKIDNDLEFTYLSPINWGGLPANIAAEMKFPVTLKSSVDANIIRVLVQHTDGVQNIVVSGSWDWQYVKAGDSKVLDLTIPLAYLQGERLKGYTGGYTLKVFLNYKDTSKREFRLEIPIDFVMPT